jgi:hypothetical protein
MTSPGGRQDIQQYPSGFGLGTHPRPWGSVNDAHFDGQGSRERDKYMTQRAMMTEGPQRMRALERANEVRLARADLKRRIAQGDVCAADIILDCPWEASTWSVGDLLLSQRRWGSTRCRKFLVRNQINEKKQIGDLTDRQRRLLAEQLETFAPPEFELVPA